MHSRAAASPRWSLHGFGPALFGVADESQEGRNRETTMRTHEYQDLMSRAMDQIPDSAEPCSVTVLPFGTCSVELLPADMRAFLRLNGLSNSDLTIARHSWRAGMMLVESEISVDGGGLLSVHTSIKADDPISADTTSQVSAALFGVLVEVEPVVVDETVGYTVDTSDLIF